ncbi:MAG: beta-glucosidase BglX [Pseudomonadota bacterium]|nr:beta-glucosidase BglX [Pseudomonadota bacterium]
MLIAAALLSAAAVSAAPPAAERGLPLLSESDRARVDALLGRMSLDEKIGQLNQIPGGRSKSLNSRLGPQEYERVRRGAVGSYLHVAGAEPLRELQRIAIEESRLGIPLLFAMDVVHGYRTIFPVPLAVASSWDPALAERAARIAAVEASASGLHWTFAPMVDIARDPRWGRIVEGAGEDPFLGSAMAAAQVRGYQGRSLAAPDTIMATAKHFAAYGAAEGGRDYDAADISERTLHEIYLPPFAAAAEAGSFMTSFNSIGGVPVTADRALVRGLLRETWGYQGLVVSDWNAITELKNHGVAQDDAAAAAAALSASIDMDMASTAYLNALRKAVERDPALMRDLDEAVRRVLAAKARLGLFEDPYRYHDAARERRVMLSAEHRRAAREIAEKSVVLLKNDGGLLPLASKVRRIAVVGALAADANSQLGSWRAQGKAEDVKPLLPALQAALPRETRLVFEAGASPRSDDRSGIAAAVEAARQADLTILVVGEDFDLSGEARSRSDLSLPGAQQALAEAVLDTGKPVVLLLMNGRPLALEKLAERAPAILEGWFLGVEAGPALANILTGKVSPGGKLPVSFPRRTGAVPSYYNHLPTGRPADPDLAKDSARYLDLPITPSFPFGHGLSYSSFAYGPIQLDRRQLAAGASVTISITITNSGRVTADEVPQLYIRDPVASVSRPVQELRGFRRITLRPGETRRLSFKLDPRHFAFWQAGRWRVEPGAIELMIGSSSADIRARGRIHIMSEAAASSSPAVLGTITSEEKVR